MQIADGKVAFFHYTLTNDQGDVLDTSSGKDPLGYVHGTGTIIPGLEQAMTGKSTGDSFKVSIEPEDAYGQHNQALVQRAPRQAFPPDDTLEPGMQFQAQTEGGTQVVTILEVGEEEVVIDGNHPLAGMRLNFDVDIQEVRDATEEETSHGHAHGPGSVH